MRAWGVPRHAPSHSIRQVTHLTGIHQARAGSHVPMPVRVKGACERAQRRGVRQHSWVGQAALAFARQADRPKLQQTLVCRAKAKPPLVPAPATRGAACPPAQSPLGTCKQANKENWAGQLSSEARHSPCRHSNGQRAGGAAASCLPLTHPCWCVQLSMAMGTSNPSVSANKTRCQKGGCVSQPRRTRGAVAGCQCAGCPAHDARLPGVHKQAACRAGRAQAGSMQSRACTSRQHAEHGVQRSTQRRACRAGRAAHQSVRSTGLGPGWSRTGAAAGSCPAPPGSCPARKREMLHRTVSECGDATPRGARRRWLQASQAQAQPPRAAPAIQQLTSAEPPPSARLLVGGPRHCFVRWKWDLLVVTVGPGPQHAQHSSACRRGSSSGGRFAGVATRLDGAPAPMPGATPCRAWHEQPKMHSLALDSAAAARPMQCRGASNSPFW